VPDGMCFEAPADFPLAGSTASKAISSSASDRNTLNQRRMNKIAKIHQTNQVFSMKEITELLPNVITKRNISAKLYGSILCSRSY